MQWIELTLNDSNGKQKIMQRVDQISDIYIGLSGKTYISPVNIKGNDYSVEESYEDIQKALIAHDEQVFEVITKEERQEELNQIKKWMADHGYDLSEV